jgi:predicted RNA binding protein YcfA (HicA-like mRNA interferase family)
LDPAERPSAVSFKRIFLHLDHFLFHLILSAAFRPKLLLTRRCPTPLITTTTPHPTTPRQPPIMAPTLKARDVIPILRKLGWREVKGRGSHSTWHHPTDARAILTIASHGPGGVVSAAQVNVLRSYVDREDPRLAKWFVGVPEGKSVAVPVSVLAAAAARAPPPPAPARGTDDLSRPRARRSRRGRH